MTADARVGFDAIDQLPLRTMPDAVTAAARPSLTDATTAIATEGGRGRALHRLLARDIVATKTQLRYLQGLRNIAIERWSAGEGSERRVQVLERLVDAEHRRLIAAINTISRLGAAPVAVRVTAMQAAVSVNGDHR